MNIKKTLKAAALPLLRSEPFLRLIRRIRLHRKIVVLMYHEVARDGESIDAWTVVKQSSFERQIEYLREHYNVLALKDALEQGGENRAQAPSVVVTFDDGYSGNAEVVLPIIESKQLPITIFVSTEAVEEQKLYWYDALLVSFAGTGPCEIDLVRFGLDKYRINVRTGSAEWAEKERLLQDLKRLMPQRRHIIVEHIVGMNSTRSHGESRQIAPLSIEQVRHLAECPLVTIGAHSHCHNLLTQLPLQRVRESVRKSKDLLEAWIQKPVDCFAYPNGSFNDEIVEVVRECGFTCGLTTVGRPWEMGTSPYLAPRIGVGRYDSMDLFRAKVSGAFLYA